MRQALRWNPQGNRGKEIPKNTWKQKLETKCKKMGREWKDLPKMALDWKALIEDLCLPRGEEEERTNDEVWWTDHNSFL
uniref:Uncharacterized protein n=1 Tax=Arion vulgaris TaxID=1028688 RepID=A0A0B7AIJ7_9EUPU